MRKTSAFARKRRAQGLPTESSVLSPKHYQQWQHAIKVRQSYSDAGLIDVALSASNRAKVALAKFLEHRVPDDDTEPFDMLAHALGVATLRAIEIHGAIQGNPVLPILDAGNDALGRARLRWEKTGKWGLDGPGRQELTDAVDVYHEILVNSSPMQMQKACDMRYEIITGKRQDPQITVAS